MGSVVTSAGAASTVDVNGLVWTYTPTVQRQPLRDLFDIEVFNSREFALIPKNDVAREIANMWVSGSLRASGEFRGLGSPPFDVQEGGRGQRMERLTITHEVAPLLTSGGDPYYTGRSITKEEHDIAIAAIEAHRASKRPTRRKRTKRTR